jgi:hypothetical protein
MLRGDQCLRSSCHAQAADVDGHGEPRGEPRGEPCGQPREPVVEREHGDRCGRQQERNIVRGRAARSVSFLFCALAASVYLRKDVQHCATLQECVGAADGDYRRSSTRGKPAPLLLDPTAASVKST